jgi:hypothetical protein
MKRGFLIAAVFCVFWCVLKQARCETLGYGAAEMRDPFENQLPEKEIIPLPQDMAESGMTSETMEFIEEQIVPPALTVESLVAGGPVPQAIIGGRIFRVGDTVEEARITKIIKEGVEILYKGKAFWLSSPSSRLRVSFPDFTDKEKSKEDTNAP